MLGVIVRFVVSALVLLFVSYLVPGFHLVGFWNAIFAAAVIAAVGWVIEAMFGRRLVGYGRGLIGFLVSAAVIYAAQFVVVTMHVTLMGALIAALVIGVIDAFVPSELH